MFCSYIYIYVYVYTLLIDIVYHVSRIVKLSSKPIAEKSNATVSLLFFAD